VIRAGWFLMLIGWLVVIPTAAEEILPPPAVTAHVTYVSGDSIYVDAGTDRGLELGEVLDVIRDGETVAKLLVQTLSAKRAVAYLVGDPAEILVGDEIRWAALEEDLPAVSNQPGVEPIRISHFDESSVYLDAGKNRGLHGGERLRVVRDGAFIAIIQVTDVTKGNATATVIDNPGLLEPGDFIRTPTAADVDLVSSLEPLTPEPRKIKKPRPSRRDRIVRGRVGVRYLQVKDEMVADSGFSQPALSLRVDVNGAGGGRLDLAVDTRVRRTYRPTTVGPTTQDNQTRVYRLTAAIHDHRSRHVLVAGRQFSSAASNISVFDGVLAALNRKHLSVGVFSGTQPEPIDYGYDNTIREHGAYLQFHNQPEAKRRWSVTSGLIGSYQAGQINREFAYFQLLANGRRGSIYLTQELDYNRDWKLVAGEDPYSLTSSYINIGYRIGKGFSLRVGHDDRRNVRLYRDLITPETEFDDSFRTGTWIGFTQRIRKRYSFGLDSKRTDGENTEPADTYTLTLGAGRITSKNLSLRYRGTHYENEFAAGNLHALNVSMSLAHWVQMALYGGLRDDTNLLDPLLDNEVLWYGLGLDFNVGRQWFIQVSSERTDGRFQMTSQSYLGMTFRF